MQAVLRRIFKHKMEQEKEYMKNKKIDVFKKHKVRRL